jgi:hypothetical protein
MFQSMDPPYRYLRHYNATIGRSSRLRVSYEPDMLFDNMKSGDYIPVVGGSIHLTTSVLLKITYSPRKPFHRTHSRTPMQALKPRTFTKARQHQKAHPSARSSRSPQATKSLVRISWERLARPSRTSTQTDTHSKNSGNQPH